MGGRGVRWRVKLQKKKKLAKGKIERRVCPTAISRYILHAHSPAARIPKY